MKNYSLFRRSIRSLAVFCLTGLVWSCSEPKAEFKLGATVFRAGDTVRISNSSIDAERFEWFVNTKLVSEQKDLKYVPDAGASGIFTVTLKGYDGDKLSQSTQTIMVVVPSGTISAWSTFAGVQIVEVGQNGDAHRGITSSGYENDPGCNAGGCVNFTVLPGTYTVDGLSEVTRSRRVVEVHADACVLVKMH